MKKPRLWIYEYKDDVTPIGATIIDEFVEDIEEDNIKLPHLHGDWCWRVNISYEEKEKDEYS